jgi:hypothetical protein
MKETKTYHAQEHKNHQQQLKKYITTCIIYSTEDFINQWGFWRYVTQALLALRPEIYGNS